MGRYHSITPKTKCVSSPKRCSDDQNLGYSQIHSENGPVTSAMRLI
jgi:hypothetical protein